MFRQSPSRNQRSKGFKVKHALQICLLLAVCIWLLYQVKHSYDKKNAFDASNGKVTVGRVEIGSGLIKLGRKDIHPRVEEMASENEGHTEEEEEEESKHEDEEEESKPEESDEEGGGDGYDEIDEQDQERADEEAERGEDFIDEEEREREEKDNQIDFVGSSEDQNHDRNTQESREENYKGDDASSAVFRDTQSINTEGESGGSGNSNQEQVENIEKNEFEREIKTNGTGNVISDQTDLNLNAGDNVTIEGDPSVNVTTDLLHVNSNSTAENGEISSVSLNNGTDAITGSTQDHSVEMITSNGSDSNLLTVVPEQTESKVTATDQLDSNSTLPYTTENADATEGESTHSSSDSETIIAEELIGKSNATAGALDNSVSSTTNENGDAAESEKFETNSGTGEAEGTLGSSTTDENADTNKSLPNDSNDSSISQEEKETHIDLETLPETETKEANSGVVAAE